MESASPWKTKELPSGFVPITDIVHNSRHSPGSLVSVIGLVTDCQLPTATNGKDHKCTLTLCDLSSNDISDGIVLNIFRPEATMPKVGWADVVVVHNAKVQKYKTSFPSLITNYQTKIRVYSKSKIPWPPNSAASALVQDGEKYEPTEEIHYYVPRVLRDMSEKGIMISQTEFMQRTSLSLNIKQKFCLLSDVNDGKFCDLVVQVCRDPFDHGDKATLYVTDYTENTSFFNFSSDSIKDITSRRADPYGYTGVTNGEVEDAGNPVWMGPLGQRAIQLTVFEPHAGFVRDHVTAGTWISLRNVLIKYGRDNQNLEAKLHGDLNNPSKINVSLVDLHAEADGKDLRAREVARCKEAVRRWRQYDAEKNAQLKQLKAAETAGVKRKAAMQAEAVDDSLSRTSGEGEPRSKNSLKRARKKAAEREAALKGRQHPTAQIAHSNTNNEGDISAQSRQAESPQIESPHPQIESPKIKSPQIAVQLNPHIKCESHPSAPITSIATILAPSHHTTTIEDEPVPIPLPFVNNKYKTLVRVVDFFPPSLTEFTVPRSKPKYDIVLSDDDTSSADDEAAPPEDATWEWSFSLQLEDASSASPQRVWVVVDNFEGQHLTGLDATDHRRDVESLSKLHDRMAILWGNLAEIKNAKRMKNERAARGNLPPDSSDSETEEPAVVGNMPFACYIKEYGVPFQRAGKAGAEQMQEGKRVFALIGTQIQR